MTSASEDAVRAAGIHAEAFAGLERIWTASEIAALAAAPGAVLLIRPDAFLLGRVTPPEAEVLSLAVRPSARRRGLAGALLAEFAVRAAAEGASEAFLEVAEGAAAARALYARAGWRAIGRRRGYVLRPDGGREDALVLRLAIDAREGGVEAK